MKIDGYRQSQIHARGRGQEAQRNASMCVHGTFAKFNEVHTVGNVLRNKIIFSTLYLVDRLPLASLSLAHY